LGITINVLRSELGTIRHDGQLYVLTERGQALLESEDPDELRDWLLTRVLGIDHVIIRLREDKQVETSALVSLLQTVNPGWTASFAPMSQLHWLRSLDVVEWDADRYVRLTERGRNWAEYIHWVPEVLPSNDEDMGPPTDGGKRPIDTVDIEIPKLTAIRERVLSGKAVFSVEQISSLHMGLWA